MRRNLSAIIASAAAALLTGCVASTTPQSESEARMSVAQASVPIAKGQINPENWPLGKSPFGAEPEVEARVQAILAKMSLEQKVGQIIQADMNSITPEQVAEYHIGSILNGGNSGPGGDDRAPAAVWLEWADKYYDASMSRSDVAVNIPMIWGSDAVHGNSNIIGATIFPHNIGLGAARNPELLREIGKVTAKELRVIGGDWTFAPTIAVVRDDRWGRTYEGYSERPEIVADYARTIVEGLQGKVGEEDFLRPPYVIATAKHFLGDGGTTNGRDQGDTEVSEAELRDLFAPAYYAAVEAGVQSVMASYNSFHGKKMHGHGPMLKDVLVGRIGFDGLVVGDWNGHGQVEGCTTTDCAQSLMAGVDVFMAPDSWKDLFETTLAQARSGEIPMSRLDEAVARVLRVKVRAGIFEMGRPSARAFAGQYDLLGAPEHRAVSRQAARESLVLLKNDGALLPLRRDQRIMVAGDGADSMMKQTGGWTISWQGLGNSREDFPNAQTIFEGISEQVSAGGGKAILSEDGSYSEKPDVAIVVFGEDPYAEFQGDRQHVNYESEDDRDLKLLERLKAQGIPVVSVFISGRPMYVNPELNASTAFVAAWLPGSEGGGLADVLLRKADGRVNYDFRGALSFSWPRDPTQTPLNVGDADYDPLFAYGFGRSYADKGDLGEVALASRDGLSNGDDNVYYSKGRPTSPWRVETEGAVQQSAVDRLAQEDAIRLVWNGVGGFEINGASADLTRAANAQMMLSFHARRTGKIEGAVDLYMTCSQNPKCGGRFKIAELMNAQADGEWVEVAAPLSCFADAGMTLFHTTSIFGLEMTGSGQLDIADVKLEQAGGEGLCPAWAVK